MGPSRLLVPLPKCEVLIRTTGTVPPGSCVKPRKRADAVFLAWKTTCPVTRLIGSWDQPDALSKFLATNFLPRCHQIKVPVIVRIGKTRLTTKANIRVGHPKISPE